SIALTWGENREGVARGAGVYVTLTSYVSTAGRLFTRTLHGAIMHSHRTMTQVGYDGPGDRSTRTTAQFQGRSLIMTNQNEGGARQIVVDFDATFSTCQAKVMHGREVGKNAMHLSGMNAQQIEVHSVSVSGVSCSIKEGNALAGS